MKSRVPVHAPVSGAAMNPTVSDGLIPAKVFVMERASVTAGLANDVEGVNQYAAAMYSPTAKGTEEGRLRTHPQMTVSSPKVARNSLSS